MGTHTTLRGGLDNPTENGPRLLLAEHHEDIEAACNDLQIAMHCDDWREVIERYRALEHAVLDHLAAEEEEILPMYSKEASDDALVIYDQHAELRKRLFRIGVEVEMHAVKMGTVTALIETLRTHARHEDAGMYPWAQVHLPMTTKRKLFVRISESLRALARVRARFAQPRTEEPTPAMPG